MSYIIKQFLVLSLSGLVVAALLFIGCTSDPDAGRPGFSDSDTDTDSDTDSDSDSDVDEPIVGVGYVGDHGRLQVDGTQLEDQNGNAITIRGTSLHWSNWFPDYFTAELVDEMVDNWNVTLIRAPLGIPAEHDGYLTFDAAGRAAEVALIETVVNQAIARGIYVIIDWHDHYADDNVAEAVAFFSDMSARYGDYPNVIFEIWNEPLEETWSTIKAYSEQVIPAIRANSDNLILVGTPNYSLNVQLAKDDPITDPNLMYVLHFYCGLQSWAQVKLNYEEMIAAGHPVFVSEWGVWAGAYEPSEGLPDGDWRNPLKTATYESSGTIDNALAWLDETGVSWAMWSVSDKPEPSAFIHIATTIPYEYADRRTVGEYIFNYFQTAQ